MQLRDAAAPVASTPDATAGWPPPGLEAIRGAARPATASFALGSALLVLPLLVVVTGDGGFRERDPFDSGWRLFAVLATLGAVALIDGVRRLARLLLGAARAAGRGHGIVTLAAAAVDAGGDTGFLVRGERAYAALDHRARAWQLRVRIAGAAALLLALAWVPAGFGIAVRVAASGALGPAGIGAFALGPALALAGAGLACRIVDRLFVGYAGYRSPAAVRDVPVGDASVGRDGHGTDDGVVGGGPAAPPGVLRAGAVALVVVAVLVIAPLLTFAAASVVGPVVASETFPRSLAGSHRRVAVTESLRPYRVPPDSTISPAEAGIALHALLFVGSTRERDPLLRAPARRYETPWFPPDAAAHLRPGPRRYAMEILPRAARDGLEPGERAWLARTASHPAHHELEIVARAPAVDVLGGRWNRPLPDSVTRLDLPMPRLGWLWTAAYAHVARAALELDRGRIDAAERTVREVLSAGLALYDNGPTWRDNATGAAVARFGGTALASLYRATGRAEAADRLERLRRTAERAVAIAAAVADAGGAAGIRAVADLVENADVPRGIRWPLLGWFNTVVPCVGPRRLVFGPGPGYDDWLERVRATLVRSPADAELFAITRRGDITARDGTVRIGEAGRIAEARWASVLLPLLGGRDDVEGCAALMRAAL